MGKGRLGHVEAETVAADGLRVGRELTNYVQPLLITQSVKDGRELDVFGGGMEFLHDPKDTPWYDGCRTIELPAVGATPMPEKTDTKTLDWTRIAAAIEAAYIRELLAR